MGYTESYSSDRTDCTYALILLRYTGLLRKEDPGGLNYRIRHSVECNRCFRPIDETVRQVSKKSSRITVLLRFAM